MDKLASYYARRAAEYERIYAKPERQADLATLRARIRKIFAKKKVLELACGTGYWTEIIAASAAHVSAFDSRTWRPTRASTSTTLSARAPETGNDHAAFRQV